MVKVVTNNLEGLYNETEDKDLSMVNVSFKVITIREAHLNKTICNTVIPANLISREIIQIAIEAEAGAVDLSNSEDVAMEGPVIRIAMEGISIIHTTHNQNNMALPTVYVADLIIPPSIATVRRKLAMHCSVTPFVIRQPIRRPRLLERVYKPMCTLQ